MRLPKVMVAGACLIMLTLSWWQPGDATLVRAGEDVEVAEGETVVQDLALFGSTISVSGYVESDVIAFGKNIEVPGIINQDLMGGAETVEITGQVGDDVRAGARLLEVYGQVGDDLIAFCQEFTLGEDGLVGGEAQTWCQKAFFYGDVDGNVRASCEQAEIHGHVGGNLSVDARYIELAGAVDGDAQLKGENITLLPECIVTGNLQYTSVNQLEIQEGAQVLGETEWQKPEEEVDEPRKKGIGGFRMFLTLAMLVGQFVIGLILIAFSRKQPARVANTLTGHPWKSLGVGFVFAVCVPIASLILMVTIIGLPLGIIALLLYLIVWYFSALMVGLTLGGKIVGAFKTDRFGPMLGGLILGLIIIRAISLIPGVGWVIILVASLFGMGALVLSKKETWAEAKEKGII
jgi:hypothetical protein